MDNNIYKLALDYNKVRSTYATEAVSQSILGSNESFTVKIIRTSSLQIVFETLDKQMIVIPPEWILCLAPILPILKEETNE